MKKAIVCLFAISMIWLPFHPVLAATHLEPPSCLVEKIPARSPMALTGDAFARKISELHGIPREHLIYEQLTAGNLPAFLRSLVPVSFRHTAGGRATTVTVFSMPDYLAIGSDQDFIRIPMGLHAAAAIADRFGFILPTTKIVDAIFHQASIRLNPEPMQACPAMRSTAYYLTHNLTIARQLLTFGCSAGELIAGHKKDLVLTNRLTRMPGRVAIYGWHRPSGVPIQPLSTVHGANYADYSHGVRLISNMVLLDGELCSIWRILEDPKLADILTDEGPLKRQDCLGPLMKEYLLAKQIESHQQGF